jgi:hypothetical protein
MQQSLDGSKKQETSGVNLRNIALPVEHGGWGFLLEPLLLGLLLAPTAAAVTLALAVVAAFLLRQPVKVILQDRRRRYSSPRTQAAWRFTLLYSAIAFFGGAATLWLAGLSWLLAPLIALPFGVVFLYYDLTQPGRTWQAELSAPIALASAAAGIVLIDGWPLLPALAIWGALTARSVPSILFVRARLRLDRGKAVNVMLPILAHVLGLLVVLLLIWQDLLPLVAGIPFVLLLIRAIHGVSPLRLRMSVKAIGFIELGLGILLVLFIVTGY